MKIPKDFLTWLGIVLLFLVPFLILGIYQDKSPWITVIMFYVLMVWGALIDWKGER